MIVPSGSSTDPFPQLFRQRRTAVMWQGSLHDELWRILFTRCLILAAEFGVGIDYRWDALRRVEAGNLDNVFACLVSDTRHHLQLVPWGLLTTGPVQLSHALCMALGIVVVHIVARVPRVQVFIQPIKPVSVSLAISSSTVCLPVARGRQVHDLLARHRMRHECWYRVTDEHIGIFDVAPDKVPCLGLRRSRGRNQITPNLDVGSEKHRAVRR